MSPFRLLRNLRQRDRREDELGEELAFHLDMAEEEARRRGADPEAARREARLRFGSPESVAEQCREAWGVRMVETLVEDVRGALRQLRASPGFSASVLLTLGLGIGANAAIFALVDAVVLRPLPYDQDGSVVSLRHASDGDAHVGFSPLELADYRKDASSLASLVEYHSMPFTLLRPEAERVQVAVVSAAFFDVLGVKPVLGRTFRAGEDEPGAEPVVVLTHAYWTRNLGSDPAVVGRTFRMNDRVHTVVGVLPPVPLMSAEDQVFMPVSACPFRNRPNVTGNRQARMLNAYGRLKPGVAATAADTELSSISRRFATSYPALHRGNVTARAVPLQDALAGDARGTLLALLAAVSSLLLIVCANVANLMLARLVHREKELAVRASLGAGRGRLLRQLVTESTVLAVLGGLLGLLVAGAGLELLRTFAERLTPRAADAALDGRMLLFTLVVSVGAGIVAGSLPGLPAERRLSESLRDGGGRSTAARAQGRLRQALVVGQIAVSLVLLVGAALLMRTAFNLSNVDTGFRPEQAVSMRVTLNWSRYTGDEAATGRVRTFFSSLVDDLRAAPGVSSVALGQRVPLDAGGATTVPIRLHGSAADEVALAQADLSVVSEDWFPALGVPLVRGRAFTEHDGPEGEFVAIVSLSTARRVWGERDPVGARVSLDDGQNWWTVVGVVGDVRQDGLSREAGPQVYLPFRRNPSFQTTLVVRGTDAASLVERVRQAVNRLDPETPVSNVRTLEQLRTEALAAPRVTALLQALFAGLALLVTAAGLAGVIAYSVGRRTQEIGIRVALGASRFDVVRLVLQQGMVATLAGVAVGALGALAVGRVLSGLLFGVDATDTTCFLVSAAVLVVVAALACLVPARRATSIDPLTALRS